VDRDCAFALAPGLDPADFLEAPALPTKTVIALDASDFISGEGDQPRFDLSEQTALHEEDTTPLPLASTGSPNTVAAPMRSMFQTDTISLRFIQHVTWMMGRTGRVAVVTSVTW
jgi:hypothetical protein